MDIIRPKGFIEARIKYKDGRIEILRFKNQVLNTGKQFLAKCLLEGSKLNIAHILYGDGGTVDGNPKEVSPDQDKLYGVTRVKKKVVAQIDTEMPTQVVFSAIVEYEEGNEFPLNEMGLELSDGTLFSLSTFNNFNKTDQMEIGWSWVVCFI